MVTVTEFLLARLAEDEAVAREAALTVGWDGFGDQRVRSGQQWVYSYHVVKRVRDDGPTDRRTVADCGSFVGMGTAPHVARWDPARVLAEVEAKRRIVEHHSPDDNWSYGEPCTTLHLLALPYSDHPDYHEDWRAVGQ
jgi:hypothetical protein